MVRHTTEHNTTSCSLPYTLSPSLPNRALESPFYCLCGSSHCIGTVLGYKYLNTDQRQRICGLIAPHIERKVGIEVKTLLEEEQQLLRRRPPLRVCVLTSSYEQSQDDPLSAVDDYRCSPSYFFQGGETADITFTDQPLHKSSAYSKVTSLCRSGDYDVFFNLCDGAKDGQTAGVEVVEALLEGRAAFTGAASVAHYEPSKVDQKRMAGYAGVNVPAYMVHRFGTKDADLEVDFASACLTFPVIVKHVSGYSSVGMTRASKCFTFAELRSALDSFEFGDALVEDFIEGEELTVLAYEKIDGDSESEDTEARRLAKEGFGPTANAPAVSTLAPIMIRFPQGETFKHFDMKWVDHEGMAWRRTRNPLLDLRCRDVAAKAFSSIMGGIGYGRVDLRVDSKGVVWFLEINPNCGLFYPPTDPGSADWILRLDPTVDAAVFTRLMVHAALKGRRSRALSQPPYELSYSARQGHYLRATQRIPAGGLVFADEGSPFHLVSRGHVEKMWKAENDLVALGQYGWPIADGLYAIWSSDYKKWRPINHSCDPNLWFGESHSLHVYARRAILAGESLTMDYATFCSGDYFVPFKCMCGASTCRGSVNGNDFVRYPHLTETYGTRVTAYVYSVARHNRLGGTEDLSSEGVDSEEAGEDDTLGDSESDDFSIPGQPSFALQTKGALTSSTSKTAPKSAVTLVTVASN
jgi:D-alanine-D-alanine ligase-like ATP-grasp enzyme